MKGFMKEKDVNKKSREANIYDGEPDTITEAVIDAVEAVFEEDENEPEVIRRKSKRKRVLGFLATVGPGLIVMVGDNDAGGVDTYTNAGQNYGLSLLWVLILLLPVLLVNQEMVIRLGVVTKVGHAKLVNSRFGKGWGLFSVGDLFILNFLTLMTEFIGIDLVARYFGLPNYIVIPAVAVLLIVIVIAGNFKSWERSMLVFVGLALLQIPMFFLSKPNWGQISHDLTVPGVQGGINSTSILLIIAIVGTTVAPWQLFFQQSNVIDKGLTPKQINYERTDTFGGAVFVIICGIALVVTANYAAIKTGTVGQFTDAGNVARLLSSISPWLGHIFAIVLLDASIVGAAAVSLSTSYAFGDVLGINHSLEKPFNEAKKFYISYIVMVIFAAGIVMIPHAPLGLITTVVQALAGLLLPSATVFLLILCNDKNILGPWVNPRWLNAISIVIVSVLLILSAILMTTTMFPNIDVVLLTKSLFLLFIVVGIIGIGTYIFKNGLPKLKQKRYTSIERLSWTMGPLETVDPTPWSFGTKVAMIALRLYLVFGIIMLIIKGITLAN